jgi:hypothetical protein
MFNCKAGLGMFMVVFVIFQFVHIPAVRAEGCASAACEPIRPIGQKLMAVLNTKENQSKQQITDPFTEACR